MNDTPRSPASRFALWAGRITAVFTRGRPRTDRATRDAVLQDAYRVVRESMARSARVVNDCDDATCGDPRGPLMPQHGRALRIFVSMGYYQVVTPPPPLYPDALHDLTDYRRYRRPSGGGYRFPVGHAGA
jgi:hypothetical protein